MRQNISLKNIIHPLAGVVLTIAGTVFVACSSEDNTYDTIQKGNRVEFSLNVDANKGENNESNSTNRALSFSGSKLVASWATNEKVYVRHDGKWASGGYLTPQSNGKSTTLSGTISFEPGHKSPMSGDLIELKYPKVGFDYTDQDGTIETIAEKYDFACGSTSLESATDFSNFTAQTTTFESQQAIVFFRLSDKVNDYAPLVVEKLKIASPKLYVKEDIENGTVITGENEDLIVTPNTPTNEFYVALRGLQDADVRITAYAGGKTYFVEKKNVTFEHGKIYQVNLIVKERTIYYLGYAAYGDPELTFSKDPNTVHNLSQQGTVTINSTCNFEYTKDGSNPITTAQFTTDGINLPSFWSSRGWENEGKYIFIIIPQAFYQYTPANVDNAGYFLDVSTGKKYLMQAGNSMFEIQVPAEHIWSAMIDGVPYYVTRMSNNGVTQQNWNFFDKGFY